jgi:predicted amidohydrolase YtcJ
MTVTVFPARTVITLDPSVPHATAVAVRDGRVLHTGTLDELRSILGNERCQIDDRFREAVLVPGFIEAHGHLSMDGALGQAEWVGIDDRPRPDGTVARGCATVAEVLDRLRSALVGHAGGEDLLAYGFDPTFHGGRRLGVAELDQVSGGVPVCVLNASGHLAYANSALLRRRGIDASTTVPGVVVDSTGRPTGEFQESALGLVVDQAAAQGADLDRAIREGGELARQAGCTTASELASLSAGPAFERYAELVNAERFPVRVFYSPLVQALGLEPAALLELLATLRSRRSERFGLGPLKLIVDGSIQGYTASLRWPGYCGGEDHSFLLLDADRIVELAGPLHDAGHHLALHTNGDRATEVALDALERLLVASPRPEHRHRLEHCQMASPAMFRRMARLGVGANLFVNHVYYWGDVHRRSTMGPDRARRMDAAATALREGVTVSLHSDHPVTPLDPLFTMWCAVNRFTRSGVLLGEHERLSPRQALRAVTLGAAELLCRDDELGSIEVGKHADLTALSHSPLEVHPSAIREIEVLGTVLGGVPTEAAVPVA